MAIIPDVDAQGIINRAAYIRKYLEEAIAGGIDFFDRVTATDDPSVELPMGLGAHNVDLALADASFANNVFDQVVSGLLQHLARQPETGETKAVYTSIDDYLEAAAWRVPIQFSEIVNAATGSYLAKANVYDDVKDLGNFAISGAGAGDFNDGVALDSVHTGGNNLEAVCETIVTSCSLTVTGRKPDGTTENKTITVAGAIGVVVAIGAGSDIYTDITTVVINSGGAGAQVVGFRSKLDRAMAL